MDVLGDPMLTTVDRFRVMGTFTRLQSVCVRETQSTDVRHIPKSKEKR